MTFVSAGYQQTVSEAQWARMFDAAPYWCDGSGGKVFVPTAGQRKVQANDGAVFGQGVRDVLSYGTDVQAVLSPPASGGQWVLIALRREWGTASTKGSKIVQIAGGTTDGSIPTAPPTTIPTGTTDTSFLQGPGVKDDQALAWVHVRAADTTLTIFDLRLRRTGSGAVAAATFWALFFHAALGILADDSIVPVDTHVLPSGGSHLRSLWRRRGDTWEPDTRIVVRDSAAVNPTSTGNAQPYATSGTSRADLLAINSGWANGTNIAPLQAAELVDDSSGMVFRAINGRWVPWDSQWFRNLSTPVVNWNMGTGSNQTTYWRYVAGQVRFYTVLTFGNGAQANGALIFTLPVSFLDANEGVVNGNFQKVSGGTQYDLAPIYFNGTYVRVKYRSGNPPAVADISTSAPSSLSSGDQWRFQGIFEPALQ